MCPKMFFLLKFGYCTRNVSLNYSPNHLGVKLFILNTNLEEISFNSWSRIQKKPIINANAQFKSKELEVALMIDFHIVEI